MVKNISSFVPSKDNPVKIIYKLSEHQTLYQYSQHPEILQKHVNKIRDLGLKEEDYVIINIGTGERIGSYKC